MEENQKGKRGSVLFWIISIAITAILGVFAMNFLGFPVSETMKDWGNKVPVINKLIPDSATSDSTPKKQENADYWKEQYSKLEEDIKEKDQKIQELTKQLTNEQAVKKNNEEWQKQEETKKIEDAENQKKQLNALYGNMKASKAAAMMESMSLEESSLTLFQLNQDTQSSILGKMKDPKKAGQITIMLKDMATFDETDPVLLKELVSELAKQHQTPPDVLAETIAAMPSEQAAAIIKSMMETNAAVAMKIMKSINTTSRSQILTEITEKDEKLAAQITANLTN